MRRVQKQEQRTLVARRTRNEKILVDDGGCLWYVFFLNQDKDEERTIECILSGRSAHVYILGFNIGAHGTVRLNIRTTYGGADTAGRVWIKSILGGDAQCQVEGMIRIEKEAVGADGYFTHNALVLSPHAQVKTSPSLEIEANEVRASHAATVGYFDDDVLFYLQSRGIAAAAAKKLVLLSFVSEYLGEIPSPAVRSLCVRKLHKSIAALDV